MGAVGCFTGAVPKVKDIRSVALIGGSSDIGVEVVARLVDNGAEDVLLLGRNASGMEEVADRLRDDGATVTVGRLDLGSADAASAYTVAVADRQFDCVILAAALLLDDGGPLLDPAPLAMSAVNIGGTFPVLRAAAAGLEAQGHGTLVVFSSVSGQRARGDNGIYSATKAALDAFTEGLRHRLHPAGVTVITVRPGFVHTKMTEGLTPAPFSTTAARVADDVVDGIARRRAVVWSPSILRWVFALLKGLPDPLWRRVAGARR
jgi:decaprenylphospho-beta-D-erythro-pentofuranosid-2-ulose 2-reductase